MVITQALYFVSGAQQDWHALMAGLGRNAQNILPTIDTVTSGLRHQQTHGVGFV